MSTTYDATPSLADRVIGADLILVGAVRGPIRVVPLDDGEPPRVHGWFEVSAERVLAGEKPSSAILLRVIGDGIDKPAWRVPVPSDAPVLAMLTRDVGPDLPENMYAPCFGGVYELSADGRARVPEDALDQLTRDLAGADGGELTIDQFHRLAAGIGRRRAEGERRLAEEEPAEVRDRPRPEMQEYPRSASDLAEPAPGGGRDARLD